MSQRMALVVAAALSVFVLVLIGGIAVNLAARSIATAQAEPLALDANKELSGQAPSAPAAQLSPEQAEQIALNLAPRARSTRAPELVDYQGTLAYEVTLDRGVVYVDAKSGKVIYDGVTTLGSAQRGERFDDHDEDRDDDDDDDDDDRRGRRGFLNFFRGDDDD